MSIAVAGVPDLLVRDFLNATALFVSLLSRMGLQAYVLELATTERYSR